MKKKEIKKRIRNGIYLFSCKDVPYKLIDSMIQVISKYDDKYSNNGRIGVMGVREEMTTSNSKMLDYKKNLEVGVEYMKNCISTSRSLLPKATIETWYKFSLAQYLYGQEKIKKIIRSGINTWHEFNILHGDFSETPEKIWKLFVKSGGKIV